MSEQSETRTMNDNDEPTRVTVKSPEDDTVVAEGNAVEIMDAYWNGEFDDEEYYLYYLDGDHWAGGRFDSTRRSLIEDLAKRLEEGDTDE